jgi:hypothetical protein
MTGETWRTKEDSIVPLEHDVALGRIQAALAGLRYGTIEIVVHEGRIVQIGRTEKLRLYRDPGASKG